MDQTVEIFSSFPGSTVWCIDYRCQRGNTVVALWLYFLQLLLAMPFQCVMYIATKATIFKNKTNFTALAVSLVSERHIPMISWFYCPFHFNNIFVTACWPWNQHNYALFQEWAHSNPEMSKLNIHSHIEHRYARTHVTCEMINRAGSPKDAIFTFETPPKAFLTNFSMWVYLCFLSLRRFVFRICVLAICQHNADSYVLFLFTLVVVGWIESEWCLSIQLSPVV